jgi:hypothetical protein
MVVLFVFTFFTPPSPHHLLLTRPTPSRQSGARAKIAPASPSFPSAAVTLSAFAEFTNALSRTARCLPISEASSKRQGDGQRFQKKVMTTTNQKNEATAPASVRPSSVSKGEDSAKAGLSAHRMRIIELSLTCNRLGGRRYFADGKRISQDRYELMEAMSRQTDCFCIRQHSSTTRHFKTIHLL